MIKLMRGDCLERMKEIPDGSVDMVLCDPPYGTTSRNEWDKVISIEPFWEQLNRVIKDNGAMAVSSQLPFSCDLIAGNRKYFRYEWIWEKTNAVGFLNANRMPLRARENILVFYKHLPKYNPQKTHGKPYRKEHKQNGSSNYGLHHFSITENDGSRFPKDVVVFDNNGRNFEKVHPTQKPVALLEYLIKTYTDEGDTVLDCCMGSGSTGVACANTGRDFIGIELDEHYFEVAQGRIDAAMEAAKDRQVSASGF